MLSSWLLFEHSDRKSGDSGIRGRISTKHEFNHNFLKNPNILIISQGHTYQEASNLLALTPEICRLTAAVDSIFGQYNYLDEARRKNILYSLFDAYERIINDRKVRKDFNLVPTFDYKNKLVNAFSGDTGKYLIFRKMEIFINVWRDGTVLDLKEAVSKLAKELTIAALENQIPIWDSQEKI
jgi:hypothetical protein